MPIRPPRKSKKGAPPIDAQASSSLHTPDPVTNKNINFKIPPEKYREFKTYASAHDMTMSQLFWDAFELYKQMKG